MKMLRKILDFVDVGSKAFAIVVPDPLPQHRHKKHFFSEKM